MKLPSLPTSITYFTGGSSQGNETRKKKKLSILRYVNICSHKTCTDVHIINIIHIKQKVETNQIYI